MYCIPDPHQEEQKQSDSSSTFNVTPELLTELSLEHLTELISCKRAGLRLQRLLRDTEKRWNGTAETDIFVLSNRGEKM